MSSILQLYHGTTNYNLSPSPTFKNPYNDFGSGLYTTPDLIKAREWSMSKYSKNPTFSFVYGYTLNIDGLMILDLTQYRAAVLAAVLSRYRRVDPKYPIFTHNASMLQSCVNISTDDYDIIYGWRSDDSFFQYIEDFMSGNICEEDLSVAYLLGNLGYQYCIKSELAFSRLELFHKEVVTDLQYRESFNSNDRAARHAYNKMRRRNGTYINDAIRSIEDGILKFENKL